MSRNTHRDTWRAGCAGTRTSGSEGGPGKRTLRKEHTAPRPDPYTHAWLNRFRGLLIRWSKKPDNHRALLQFACGLIAWRLKTAEALPR